MAKNPKLTEAQMADVKKYRAEARLCIGRQTSESVDTLAKAMAILNIKP